MSLRSLASRVRVLLALLVLVVLALAGASAMSDAIKEPDKLIILSMTDVHAETSPCGCSTPRGGIARRASFADSMRTSYGQILLVDNGGSSRSTRSRRTSVRSSWT